MATTNKKSFVRTTTLIDGKFLDINTLPSIPASPYDETYTIDSSIDQRPDLLAYKLYGSTQLWWVFALRNPDILVDPLRDFTTGVTIKLPSADTVRALTG